MAVSTALAFEDVAARYDLEWGEKPLARGQRQIVWRELFSRLAAPATVLDLGCGTGIDAVELAARGHKVVAVDGARAMLDELRRKQAVAGLEDRIEVIEIDLNDPVARRSLWTRVDPDLVLANFGVLIAFLICRRSRRSLASSSSQGAGHRGRDGEDLRVGNRLPYPSLASASSSRPATARASARSGRGQARSGPLLSTGVFLSHVYPLVPRPRLPRARGFYSSTLSGAAALPAGGPLAKTSLTRGALGRGGAGPRPGRSFSRGAREEGVNFRALVPPRFDHRVRVLEVAVLNIISTCDSCVACDYWRSTEGPKLGLEAVRRLASELTKLRTRTILLSGGEPLVHPDLGRLAEFLKGEGFELLLLTNGLRLSERFRRSRPTSIISLSPWTAPRPRPIAVCAASMVWRRFWTESARQSAVSRTCPSEAARF